MITPVTLADIPILQQLARKSWEGAYTQIISRAQIAYMLENMYATQELTRHLQHPNWRYYFIIDTNGKPAGFVGFELHYQAHITKLHRLYLLPEYKGKGLGHKLINRVKKEAVKHQDTQIILNVNKHNTAQQFYIKEGFTIIEEGIFDIGNGFVMDDYIMAIAL